MNERIVSICGKIIRFGYFTLFAVTPLLVCPWTYELFEFPKMLFVYALTVVIAAAFLVKKMLNACPGPNDSGAKWKMLNGNPLTLPIILYLLSFILSTIFSTHPATSIFGYYSRFHGGLLSLVSYIVLFYIFIAEYSNPRHSEAEGALSVSGGRKIFCYALLVAGFLVSLYGILQHFGIDNDYWIQDSSARVFSTLGQPNWLAAWLLMILPLSWFFYLSSKKFWLTAVGCLLSAVLFASFWFTYSLSGLLGFLTAGGVFAALSSRKFLWRKKKRLFLLIAVYCLLSTAFPGTFLSRARNAWESISVIKGVTSFSLLSGGDGVTGFNLLPRRYGVTGFSLLPRRYGVTGFSLLSVPVQAATGEPPGGRGDTAEIRKLVWKGALDLWQSNPKVMLIGTGPETFAYAFLPFRPTGLNQTSEWDFLYNKAHNEYLDILCEQGILGLGAYLFLVGRFFWWGIKKAQTVNRKPPTVNSELRFTNDELRIADDGASERFNTKYLIPYYLLPALFSGWVGFLITNFFGFSVVPTALLFWLYPAICVLLFEV